MYFDLAIVFGSPLVHQLPPSSADVLPDEAEKHADKLHYRTCFVFGLILGSPSLETGSDKEFFLEFLSLSRRLLGPGKGDPPPKAGWRSSQRKCKQGFRSPTTAVCEDQPGQFSARCTQDCIYLQKKSGEALTRTTLKGTLCFSLTDFRRNVLVFTFKRRFSPFVSKKKKRGEGVGGGRMPIPKVVKRKESFTTGIVSDNEVGRSCIGTFLKNSVNIPTVAPVAGWDSLPDDVLENIFQRLAFEDLFRCITISRSCKKIIESDGFIRTRGAITTREGSFTAINYYINNNEWQSTGFDLNSSTWRRIPAFSCLPSPDAALFKQYSVSGHGGLMCAEVSRWPQIGELVVFNPLTGKKIPLPPLLHPRNPVLIHIIVNSTTNSYKVIVAGSSSVSDEHLSKKTEMFDSRTSQWEEKADLPGPAFGLNEHQTGVCVDGTLYFIAFLEKDSGRGILAFNVDQGTWLGSKTCPIPFSATSNNLQLVETDGKVYLFSEQERNGSVEHCIDELEVSDQGRRLRNVVRAKTGGRGLQVYPEYVCVGFGEGRLCIFNALNRDGVVYDVRDGTQCEVLQAPPPDQTGDGFFSLNPTTFALQPSILCDQLI